MTTPEHATTRRAALRVPCPWCRAGIGRACEVRTHTGVQPLTQLPAHWARLDAAGVTYSSPPAHVPATDKINTPDLAQDPNPNSQPVNGRPARP